MECGSPHARYALLANIAGSWQVEVVVAPYDWNEASKAAVKNGREDWAHWLVEEPDMIRFIY